MDKKVICLPKRLKDEVPAYFISSQVNNNVTRAIVGWAIAKMGMNSSVDVKASEFNKQRGRYLNT